MKKQKLTDDQQNEIAKSGRAIISVEEKLAERGMSMGYIAHRAGCRFNPNWVHSGGPNIPK